MTHIHLIGIGGSGLSAIARVLLESGYTVSGSDRCLSPMARALEADGVKVYVGHAAENIRGADLIVRSSAVTDDNPEVQAAISAGIPVLKRYDFLGRLLNDKTGIAVAGTHGKTTTTAMIAWMLSDLGCDPSYIIGGVSKNLGGNARAGKGPHFVIEADEYDRMFLGLQPDLVVLTSMEHDHPDCYPTMKDYRGAFVEFVHRIKPQGLLLTCLDHPELSGMPAEAPENVQSLSYGLSSGAAYTARSLRVSARGGYQFEAWYQPENGIPEQLGTLTLQVPGEHNVQNSLAALAAAHWLGLPIQPAIAALEKYTGTGRRFDLVAEVDGISIYNDYAHHPTEIRATLSAARNQFPSRPIWAVWQPHTFSRTQTLLQDFIHSFDLADHVVVTEVFAAREKPNGFSSADLVQQMQHPSVHFSPTLDDASHYLLHQIKPGDVILVLSAGDADTISATVAHGLTHKEN